MRVLHKIGAAILVVGLLVVTASGMSIHRGPEGTCVRVNLAHGVGGVLLLCGMAITVVAAFAGRAGNTELGAAADRDRR